MAAAAAASVETGRREGLRSPTKVDYSESAGRGGGHKRRRTRGNVQASDSDDDESDSDDIIMVPFDLFNNSPKEVTVPSTFIGGYVGADLKGVRFVISRTPAMLFCNLSPAPHMCAEQKPCWRRSAGIS